MIKTLTNLNDNLETQTRVFIVNSGYMIEVNQSKIV